MKLFVIAATKKIPGENFQRECPPLITMSDEVKAKMEKVFGET